MRRAATFPIVLALLALAGTLPLDSCGRAPGRGSASAPATGGNAVTRTSPSAGAGTGLALVSADPLALRGRIRETGAKATLLNVWASWCAPCRAEFPDLVRLEREYCDRGLRVMFVSADFESTDAMNFLHAQGVDFPTYWKSGSDAEFIDLLSPKWTGALPATFIYDASGRLVQWFEGRATYPEFEKAVTQAMTVGATPTP